MRSSMFAIMQFDKPDKNYMILESIKSAPAKVVHVFDLRFNDFKVGRSVETDMKIADISVSRTHSFFRIINNRIVYPEFRESDASGAGSSTCKRADAS